MTTSQAVQTSSIEELSHYVDKALSAGGIHALVGGDGAGKSSILRALAHMYSQGKGNIKSKGVCYQPAHSGVWRSLSVKENLEFMAYAYGLDRSVAQTRTAELLNLAELNGTENRVAAHLSGGMRQKLGVIMAMLPGPDVLLLDEPTTGVDTPSRKTLWTLIDKATHDGACVLVATTYLDEAGKADTVFVLDHQTVLARGSAREVIESMPGTLWSQPRSLEPLPDFERDCVWMRGNTVYEWSEEEVASSKNMELATPDLEVATIARLLHSERHRESGEGNAPKEEHVLAQSERVAHDATYPSGEVLVECHNVCKDYPNVRALDGVDIGVASGEIVGLVGGNGAGKSTLIRMILGLEKPTSGTVHLLGKKPGKKSRAEVGYVPQSLGLYPALSAQENLNFTVRVFGCDPDIDLREYGNTPVGKLPLGAQREIATVCALSHSPRLLILDEPTSGMDPLARARLWKVLQRSAERGVGVVVTTHYRQEARQCDRLVELEQGRAKSQQ